MPVLGTTTDYSGRLKDIHVSGPLNPLQSGQQNVTYKFGRTSQYIAGPQKLVQRFLIKLINSGFVERLIGSTTSNIRIARELFNQYKGQIVFEFRTYQDSQPKNSIPLDEQLDTVELINLDVFSQYSTNDSIKFSAKLLTRAGDNITILLPLPII
jgi:hypothetical protein